MSTEAEVLERLYELFPDRVIYADQYKDIKLTRNLSYEVYQICKTKQTTRLLWLESNGFIWKETGYVEPDMKLCAAGEFTEYEDAFALSDYVFRSFPLAGEYILTDAESEMLYQSASHIVQWILNGKDSINSNQKVILTLATIELLKSAAWNEDFWDFIFLQYGFQPENSENARRKLYEIFCQSIKDTLKRYNRFFAPANKQRYYTSLLLHAIAPKQSIEALFNILFDFYTKNLDFQYIPEDTSYRSFVVGMRARWKDNASFKEDLKLRSDSISSGLQTLFQERPGYMAVLCDSIVKKMDALLRGEEDNLLDRKRNYWNVLLADWYSRKSSTERVQKQSERRRQATEYVATTADRIYVRYAMRENLVGITIPRIRLGTEQCRPIIQVRQNDNVIFQSEMSVIGNDLCLTTRSRFIAFDEMEYNFSVAPCLDVSIQYGEKEIFSSNSALHKNYILFNADGNEQTPKTGMAFLFASSEASVEFSSEEDVYQLPQVGQLYRINLSVVGSIAVNGSEIFADKEAENRIRIHSSKRCAEHLKAVAQGQSIDIYHSSFEATLRIPVGKNPRGYHVAIDEKRFPLEMLESNQAEYLLPIGEQTETIRSIRIIDLLRDNLVQYEYHYVILPDLQIKFDEELYRAGVDSISLHTFWQGTEHEFSFPPVQQDKFVIASIPCLPFTIEVEVPCVSCTFMGENAFSAPEAVWHEDVDAGEFVKVTVPDGWTASLMLDTNPVSHGTDENIFELGNELRAISNRKEDGILWLRLDCKGNEPKGFKITELVFSSKFLHSPIAVCDDALCWQIEGNFIGNSDTQFQVEITLNNAQNKLFDVGYADKTLLDVSELPHGQHAYWVFRKKKSVFAAKAGQQLIDIGDFIIGDSNEFVFRGKEIQLGDARCWDFDSDSLKSVVMRYGCGMIRDLVYKGKTVASGEQIAAPCYDGKMFFVDNNGNYRTFNFVESEEYEPVNPVHIWIINEHLLILRCVTDDAPYIDTRYSTIVNRKSTTTMSFQERRKRFLNPDYFEYKVKDV